MFVIIAGGGRTGTQLASMLLEQNHTVHLIEHRPSALHRLHRELPTETIFEGDPVIPEILEMAGIQQAQVIAAVTDDDANNLAICYLTRTRYNIGRTIARINNPRNAWLFNETFHVDVALNQSAIFSSLIAEEMSLGDMMTLMKLRRGNYSLVEEKIPAGAPAIGMELKNLALPDSCVIAAIIRKGKVIMPRGDTLFAEGDEVFAITDADGIKILTTLFEPPKHKNSI
ncbi:MAG: TrkA family potassium uptake protein [Anaerolineales bacterium]